MDENQVKFKIGDKVKYIGGLNPPKIGSIFTIKHIEFGHIVTEEPAEKYLDHHTNWALPLEEIELVQEVKQTKAPIPNNNPAIQDLVVKDIEARKEFGKNKYGTYLQANNGRNALQDAYEEVLDLACYLKQKLEEEKNGTL